MIAAVHRRPNRFSLRKSAGTAVADRGFVRDQRGAALLAAMCFASVLALSLGSYMTLCSRTLALSTRTMQGTHSVELAEAGMEDALWALNKNDWSAWTLTGTTATRTISGFTFDGGITGTVSIRVTSYNGTAGARSVTVTGTATQPNGTSVSRTLTSSSAEAPLFVNAISATDGIVSFSSGGTVDSYDSAVGTYASQTPSFSAIISSDAAAPTSATIQLTNAVVKGYAASRYSGGPSYSTSAKLIGPSTPGTTRIDTSRISSSPYQPIFTIKTITGSGTVLAPTPNSTTTLGAAGETTPRIYYSSGLDLTHTTKLIVAGPVRIVVSGNFDVGRNGGTPVVEVAATGTLEVFTSGDFALVGAGIRNLTLNPKRAVIYANNAVVESGIYLTEPFYGVIYAPNATVYSLGDSVIYGALVTKKMTFSGTAPAVHYDLNLRKTVFTGVDTPFAVSDWRETSN
jgi:hypothetical protein